MSVPRGKNLNRLKVEHGLKNLDVRDDMAHVPVTLYKFSTTKATSGHPMFPFRPTMNDTSHNTSPYRKELSPDVFRSSPYLGELFKPDIFRKTSQANQFLKQDRELSKVDFSKKVSDVSYLMETKSYIKEPRFNEYNASAIKRSIDLLSTTKQTNLTDSSFLNNTQNQDDKIISKREVENIYLGMKEYGKEDSMFIESLAKNKMAFQTEETPERKRRMNRSIDAEYSIFNKTLPKIVHPGKHEAELDLVESPVKEDVKNTFMMKVKKGLVVQKRAQNKNLLVPSGRKEVVSLSEWLAEMLKGVKKNKSLGVNEILDETQSIYTVCLEEIIRQVKIQCSERGQLLEKIWEAYMSLFRLAIEVSQKEMKKLEESYQDEIKKLNLKHEEEVKNHLLNLEMVCKDKDEANALLEKEIELRSLLEGRTERLTKELFNIKHDFHKAQNEIQIWRNNQQFETGSINERLSFRALNTDRKPSIQVNLEIKGAEAKTKRKDKDMTMTEENSDDISSEQPSAANLNEYLNLEDRFKDVELDTADLEQLIRESEEVVREKLDKCIQWEEQVDEKEGEQEDPETSARVIDQNKDKNQKLDDENKTESMSDESEEDTESIQSYQEMIQIQNSKEIVAVREGLDKLTRIELKEINREVQERIAQIDQLEDRGDQEIDLESVPFARESSSKKCTDKIRRTKKNGHRSEVKSDVALRTTTKEDVIAILEKYQGDNENVSISEISTEGEMIQFTTKFLKGGEEWKLQDLQHLIKKLTKKKAQSLELIDEVCEDEESVIKDLKSLTGEQLTARIKFLEQEDLAKMMEDFEKRLEKNANGNQESGNNQEVIHMLQAIVEEREDVLEGPHKSLFKKILKAYGRTLNRNMELKIENKEQEIDLTELREKQEKNENKERDLNKQINEWQERNQHLVKMNESLTKTITKTKLLNQETNAKKIQKLGSLANEYITGQGPESKDNKDDTEPTTERERRAQMTKGISIAGTLQEGIDEQQREPNTATLNIMDNIAEIMKTPNTEGDEDWSESDAKTERTIEGEERKFPARSSQRTLSVFSRQPRKTIFLSRPPGEGLKAKRILRVASINAESANALLVKTKEKKHVQSSITKQTLLKFISQFYVERLKDTKKLSPLHISVYDSFMNKYGLKKVAETKCIQIFESAVAFAYQNKKIERFKDLLGLGESIEVVEELELYLSALRQLDTSSNGVLIASNTQEKVFIGLEQAETVTISIFENKLDPRSLRELLISLQHLKSLDRASRILDFEDLIDKLFHTQKNLQNTVKGFVKEIFNATDLDNDETIELFEFNILYRQLEKDRYDKKQVRDLFFEHADLVLSDGSNEPVLSFNKFAWICLEMKLFSEEKQKIFAKVPNPADSVQNVKDLEQDIKQKLNEIRLRFMKSHTYTSQVKSIMTKLYSSVKNPIKSRNIVWLSYRLLDEESKNQLLDYEINMMLPKEFGIIQRFIDEMDGWLE